MAAVTAYGLEITVAVFGGMLLATVLGICHQSVIAIPAIQRDLESVKTGLQETKKTIRAGQRKSRAGQRKSSADVADLKLMLQRLCMKMGHPECVLPPGA